ncbi:MAG: DUF4411 family protein [Promethearchaeota archaeon]
MTTYLFDTSSFIKLKNYPPRKDISYFDKIWDSIEKMIRSSEIIIIREVFEELTRSTEKEDNVAKLVRSVQEFIFDYPEEMQKNILRRIINENKPMVGVGSKKNEADLFLIASALYLKGVIVTEEKYRKKVLNIPSIVLKYDIECIDLIEFLRREIK